MNLGPVFIQYEGSTGAERRDLEQKTPYIDSFSDTIYASEDGEASPSVEEFEGERELQDTDEEDYFDITFRNCTFAVSTF